MKKVTLIIAVVSFMISCGERNAETSASQVHWQDSGIYSTADVHNPEDEYSDPEFNIDNALAEYILNDLVNRDDVEFSDGDKVLTNQEVRELLFTVVNTIVEDPDAQGTFIGYKDTIVVEPRDIVEILTKEDWVLDRDKMVLAKKVTQLAPIVHAYDNEGNIRGKRILFWVKLNN
jgi:hypothetical protein